MSICNKQHLSNICNINCSIICNIQNEEESLINDLMNDLECTLLELHICNKEKN